MDPELARLTFTIAAWALSTIVTLLIAYWIIRLAVTHSLRSHERWKLKNVAR